MRRRLLLTLTATSVLILIAFLLPLAVLVQSVAEQRATSTALLRVQSLIPVVSEAPTRAIRPAVDLVNAGDGPDVTVFLPNDQQVGARAPETPAVELAETGQTAVVDTSSGREVAVPILGVKGGTVVIRVLISESELSQGVLGARLALLGLGVVLLLLAVAIGDTLARAFIAPIRAVAHTADELAAGDLDARATPSGPPETRSVATALNRLGARIGELLHRERESVADVSHRLRTPVTALRLDVDQLPASAERDQLRSDVDALTLAVDTVISEVRRPIREGITARCDATAVVSDRLAFWGALAEDEGRVVSTTIPASRLEVACSETDLAATVDALLGNVFAHTPAGTAFAVSLAPDSEAKSARGAVQLTVTDEGPGWRLAHPEIRGRSGSGSSGLGLDIAARTAAASGGELQRDTGPSGGAVVRVTFGTPATS